MAKTPIEILLDGVDYLPTGMEPPIDGTPYVTHEGVLTVGEIKLDAVVLNTGQRLITKESLDKFFGADFLETLSC